MNCFDGCVRLTSFFRVCFPLTLREKSLNLMATCEHDNWQSREINILIQDFDVKTSYVYNQVSQKIIKRHYRVEGDVNSKLNFYRLTDDLWMDVEFSVNQASDIWWFIYRLVLRLSVNCNQKQQLVDSHSLIDDLRRRKLWMTLKNCITFIEISSLSLLHIYCLSPHIMSSSHVVLKKRINFFTANKLS